MSKDKKDLTDKQLLAMGKKNKPIRKRILFKEYAVTYVNLGLQNRDNKTMKKELPAIAKRGANMVMRNILKKTKMPSLLKNENPFITVIIYAGVASKMDIDGHQTFTYPSPGEIEGEKYRLEEV